MKERDFFLSMEIVGFRPEEAREKASKMIGSHLITRQTDKRGRLCEEVMVCKRLFTRREYYLSFTLDRQTSVCFKVDLQPYV